MYFTHDPPIGQINNAVDPKGEPLVHSFQTPTSEYGKHQNVGERGSKV